MGSRTGEAGWALFFNKSGFSRVQMRVGGHMAHGTCFQSHIEKNNDSFRCLSTCFHFPVLKAAPRIILSSISPPPHPTPPHLTSPLFSFSYHSLSQFSTTHPLFSIKLLSSPSHGKSLRATPMRVAIRVSSS